MGTARARIAVSIVSLSIVLSLPASANADCEKQGGGQFASATTQASDPTDLFYSLIERRSEGGPWFVGIREWF